jgi:hypothetical protein
MKPDDIARYVLAALVVLGFSGVALGFIVTPKEAANRDIIMLVVGALCTGYGTVLAWFFPRRSDP